MTRTMLKLAVIAVALSLSSNAALAKKECVTKAAQATSGSEDSAKWFALETMVQAVSWSLWPNFLSTGKVDGYDVKNQKYKCTKSDGGYTCVGSATFCKK